MKKILAITAVALMAMAGTAMAAGTGDLDVTAEVLGVCTMTGGTLSFGDLDPTAPTNVTAHSADVTVTCTNGTAYALTGDNGDHYVGTQKRLANSAETSFIAYSISFTGAGTGTGAEADIDITGTIASTAYTTAIAGSYTDTVLLSVTP